MFKLNDYFLGIPPVTSDLTDNIKVFAETVRFLEK